MPSKILVVDDDIAVCKELRRFLEEKGYNVVEAYDGNEALAAYKQESPDIVLLDIRMPGKDGLETLKELKALDPEASVIMVTAVLEEEVGKQAMAEGAFDYITKPIDADYLEMVLIAKLALLGSEEMTSKVLVVDDEPDFCEALGDFLRAKGYSVLEAHDGDQALAVYRQERPDVVLLDVRMPGKDGLETLRELRAFDTEARVIMITAVPEEELDKKAISEVDEGTLDYITKPFDPDSLERTLSILKRMELLSGNE